MGSRRRQLQAGLLGASLVVSMVIAHAGSAASGVAAVLLSISAVAMTPLPLRTVRRRRTAL